MTLLRYRHLSLSEQALFTKRQIFGLVQMKTIWRRQVNVTEKMKLVFQQVENTVGKGKRKW